MQDILIALLVVVVMFVIVGALMRIAPRHDKEMTNAFEEFSMRHGLRYQAEDDGRVREFAGDFDGIGAFDSSSGSGSMPRNVVHGVLDGQGQFLFQCSSGHSEGPGPEWFVAGLELKKPLADRCSVQFCRRESDRDTTYLSAPIVKELEVGSFNVVIRANDTSGAGRLVEEQVLEELAALAEQLPWRPELQVRGNRIIAYPADHETTIDRVDDLDRLMGLAKKTVSIAG